MQIVRSKTDDNGLDCFCIDQKTAAKVIARWGRHPLLTHLLPSVRIQRVWSPVRHFEHEPFVAALEASPNLRLTFTNHIDAEAALLHSAAPNESECGGLFQAILQRDHRVAFRILTDPFERRAVDRCDRLPLHVAALAGNTLIVRKLIHLGENVNSKGFCDYTATHWASVMGHVDCLDLLHRAGADLDARDCFGNDPLFHACRSRQSSAIRYLIDHGATKEPLDFLRALGMACGVDCPTGVSILLESNRPRPSTKACLESNLRPISCAASSNSLLSAMLLLRDGVDFLTPSKDGDTPLHTAFRHGSTAVARLLIEHGANPAEVNDEGQTAFDLAQANGHPHLANLLSANAPIVDSQRPSPYDRDVPRWQQRNLMDEHAIDRPLTNVWYEFRASKLVSVLLEFTSIRIALRPDQTPEGATLTFTRIGKQPRSSRGKRRILASGFRPWSDTIGMALWQYGLSMTPNGQSALLCLFFEPGVDSRVFLETNGVTLDIFESSYLSPDQ